MATHSGEHFIEPKTSELNAQSGARHLLDRLKIYKLSIVHIALIQNVLEAVEENAKLK